MCCLGRLGHPSRDCSFSLRCASSFLVSLDNCVAGAVEFWVKLFGAGSIVTEVSGHLPQASVGDLDRCPIELEVRFFKGGRDLVYRVAAQCSGEECRGGADGMCMAHSGGERMLAALFHDGYTLGKIIIG